MANHDEEILIGIISKNRAQILPQAINSAQNQQDVKILVSIFDDNSSDETKILADKFIGVNWYFSALSKGYLFGRNKLMRETNAPFYCSLDDDSWFLNNDELGIAIQIFEHDPQIAAVAFDILSPDRPNPNPKDTPVETNIFIGCGHVLRLSAVRQVGFYEENPGFYGGEEKDLCIRLMDHGYKIVKLPGVHVWHDKTTIARDIKAQHRSGVCNDLVFAYRRIPGLKVWPLILFKTLSHFRFSLFFQEEKLLTPCIMGLVDFYRLLILRKLTRKPVSNATFKKYISLNH